MANTSVNLLASSAANAIDVAQVQAKTASTAIAKPFAQWLGDAQYQGNQTQSHKSKKAKAKNKTGST